MSTVEKVTVVPDPHAEQNQDAGSLLSEGEGSQAHIYFKDLKLLAHDDDDQGEESEDEMLPAVAESDGGSSPATTPVGDGTVSPIAAAAAAVAATPSIFLIINYPSDG